MRPKKRNLGRESLLLDVDQAELWQLVQQAALDEGLWNGKKVADWLSDKIGFQVSRYINSGPTGIIVDC